MWLWLLIPLFLELGNAPLALSAEKIGAPTELGSAPTAEAEILWKDAEAAIKEERYIDALPKLRRIVDRHPGVPFYLEAHRDLGRAYLELGQARASLAPLRYFLDGSKKMPGSVEARLLLGRAYHALKNWDELLLLSTETEKMTRAAGAEARNLLADSLRLKGIALQGLGRDSQAERAIVSANAPDGKELGSDSPAQLRAEIALAALELQEKECARFPTTKRLGEDQARDQFSRRGVCLLGSLRHHEAVSRAGDPKVLKLADESVMNAFQAYFSMAHHPPLPTPLRPVDRTARQLRLYREELAHAFLLEGRAKLKEALSLLEQKPTESALKASLESLLARSERPSS